MILLNPGLVRTAPELASLETLALVLRTTLVALTAAHPCLQSDRYRCAALAPCCLAVTIHHLIDQLDNAIIHYRAVLHDEIENEQNHLLPL